MTEQYHYPLSRIQVEYGVHFGREVKRADIVIFDKDNSTSPYIIVELKKPKIKDGKEQLRSYCNATGAPIGVWTNGDSISYYNRKDSNYFEDIPTAFEKLSDILTERWTIDDLIEKDKLVNERKSLKDLILEMEDEVLANAGVDVFEELFKLIFTKLYDEMESGRNKSRHLEFRNYGDTETELKEKIQKLFNAAKNKWDGVFSTDSTIALTGSHLSVCVASLQDVKLFNSNLDVVDDAFEYLMSKSSKGEKGQYFTPRYVIDMCVKMLNPKENETMIDTAAGSCGFPVHTIFHVWKQILQRKGIPQSHLFTLEQKPAECTDYVNNKVFAIDFDEKAVRVARTLNLIAGDGQTNVLHLNTLDYERWDEVMKEQYWQDTYFEGWKKIRKLRTKSNSNMEFNFDILMANPPFAGDIKESRMIAKYDLGKKADGKYQAKVGRDILFIERNLNFLKPGGRMAIQICLLSNDFQLLIKERVNKVYKMFQCSLEQYAQAEQMLLNELAMGDFMPSLEKVATKSFTESFGTSGRLDAEYYQTKYDTLFAKLSAVKTYLLGDLVWIKKSVEPGSNEYLSVGIPFVRVSDLSKYGLSDPEIHLNRIPFAHMNLQPKKDTILLSKDGSVGIAYKVEKDLDIVTSGAILHLELKTDQFLPDYLTLVLNSLIVKMQAERDVGGSIIQYWKPSEIEYV